ncbi:MAG: hypothetical protein AB7E37_04340 [Candidatus Altimarinota bacterium]
MKNQEGIEFDIETQKLREQLNKHLSKFKNLELLFENTTQIIQKYFEEQKEYTDIDSFTQYLKDEVIFYAQSFGKPRNEKKLIRERLLFIEQTYHEILYFGEFDPLGEKIQREQSNYAQQIKNILE